jgi:hypothetical protein
MLELFLGRPELQLVDRAMLEGHTNGLNSSYSKTPYKKNL